MRIRLLGALAVDDETLQLARRDRIVLSRLAVAAGRAVPRDSLVHALWGGEVPTSADKVVQGAVMRLRRLLGQEVIETVPGGYRLSLPPAEVDVLQFKVLAARSRELAAVGSIDRSAHTAGQALALWTGGDLPGDDGLEAEERLALVDMRRSVEEEHLDLLLTMRGGADLVERGAELVDTDPHREQRWALLARAQYRVGRQADALRTIQRAQHVMRHDLGLELSQSLAELEQRILHQDPLLDPDAESPQPAPGRDDACPYRGLLAFDVADGDVFYGRERAVGDAMTRLYQSGSLVLVGPSGSGKSSVLRAGVVASLHAEGRPAAIVELGTSTPRVASQLATLPANAVVAVDQFEELFTESRAVVAEEELDALARWRGPLAITLRSDHLDRLNGVGWLAELAERSMLLLRPPDAEDLRSAIVGPAAASGLRLEPGLVELLLRDATGQPGALPLMSHALRATWLRREGRTLTVEAYERAGGLTGAIAATADEVYEGLDDDERVGVRRLMVHLFDLSSESRPTRARVSIETALDYSGGPLLVDRLSTARLVVAGDDGLTVAHEALATAWPRLAEWLDLDGTAARRRRHLGEAARTWDEMGRPDAELYRGARLAEAVERRADAGAAPTGVEAAFLDASEAHETADRMRVDAELAARARSNRRLRAVAAAAVAMLVVVAAVTAFAVRESRSASSARDRAELAVAETARQALLGAGTSMLGVDRSLAVLLLAEADRIRSDVASRSALFGAFVSTAGFLGYRRPEGPSAVVDAAAGAGDELYVVDEEMAAWRVDVGTGAAARLTPPMGAGAGLVAVSTDRTAFALYRDPAEGPARLEVFDTANLRAVMQVDAPAGRTSLAVSPDGAYVVVSGGEGGSVDTFSVADGRALDPIDVPRTDAPYRPVLTAAVTIGRDDVLYVATLDRTIRRYRLPAVELIDTMEATVRFATTAGLVLDDDGTTLFAHGWTNHPDAYSVVARWDVATGALAWEGSTRLPCQRLAVLAVTEELACSNQFGTVELVSTLNGSPSGSVDAQQGRIGALAALDDGRRYVTAGGSDTAIGVWDAAGGGPITAVETVTARYDTPVWYSPDGRRIVAVAVPLSPYDVFDVGACASVSDGSCLLAPDLLDGETGAVVDGLDGVLGATWLGDRLAYVADDRSVGLLDLVTGEREPVDASSLTSLGSVVAQDLVHGRLFFWVTDGSSYLLDGTGRRFVRSAIPVMPARAAAFTADGERLALVSGTDLWLFDVVSGDPVAGPLPGFDSVDAAGDVVVAGDRLGGVHVLDAVTLEEVRPPLSSGSGPVQEIEIGEQPDLVIARSGDAVRVLDLAAGVQLGSPITVPRADPDEGAALRPDGRRLAVTADAGVAIWNLDPDDWYAAVCELAGRSLTPLEWDTYIGDLAPYRPLCDVVG